MLALCMSNGHFPCGALIRGLPIGKILCWIADDLEGHLLVIQAVLGNQVEGPDKRIPGGLVVVEQISS